MPLDASTPQEQRSLIQRDYPFRDKKEGRGGFTQLTGLMKNLNYAPQGSADHTMYRTRIDELAKTLGRVSAPASKTDEDR